MNGLHAHLVARINADGPLSIADYMGDCLLHPEWGYYATRDPLGVAGDFTTAPEISQMFGELIGLALAQTWMDQGAPATFALTELGPGRGTLMADMLRATRAVPGFHDAMRLHLVEASPTLRAAQRRALAQYEANWCDSVANLPDLPLFVVANEFFDALPIRQFIRDGDGWRERRIGLDADGALAFGLTDATPQPVLAHRLRDTRDGDMVETCAPATAIAAAIGTRIAAQGGAGLIFDYGGWRSLGDTFQALRGHASANPLEAPGTADLTAHVDFESLAGAARPAAHTRLTPQGVFLERLGITARAQALAARLAGGKLDAHVAAHRRLTHPDEMGTLFKVMALHRESTPPPPGFN